MPTPTPGPQVNVVTSQVTLGEGFETDIWIELDAPRPTQTRVDFEVGSVHGQPGASPDDYEIAASPIVIPAGSTRAAIRFLALHDDRVEVEECLLLSLLPGADVAPGPRADTLVLIGNDDGSDDAGGGALPSDNLLALLGLLLLRLGRPLRAQRWR